MQDERASTGHGVPDWVLVDRAVGRLQELLDHLPRSRALPDLDDLLARADTDRSLLSDERARKLLDDALRDRPLSSLEEVRVLRTEVELLTVEVSVLEERLAETAMSTPERAALLARLSRVRARCRQVAEQL